MITVNSKLILKPYEGARKVQAKGVGTGFATVAQKTTLVGLEALASGFIGSGEKRTRVVRGDTVYFPEEILYAHDWSKKVFSSDVVKEPFIIGEAAFAVAVRRASEIEPEETE